MSKKVYFTKEDISTGGRYGLDQKVEVHGDKDMEERLAIINVRQNFLHRNSSGEGIYSGDL